MHRIANRLSAEPNSEGANVAQEEEDEVHYEIVMTTFRGISMKIAANRSSVMLLGQYKAHCDEFRVPMQLNRSERKVIRPCNFISLQTSYTYAFYLPIYFYDAHILRFATNYLYTIFASIVVNILVHDARPCTLCYALCSGHVRFILPFFNLIPPLPIPP